MVAKALQNRGLIPSSPLDVSMNVIPPMNVGGYAAPRTSPYSTFTTPRRSYSALSNNPGGMSMGAANPGGMLMGANNPGGQYSALSAMKPNAPGGNQSYAKPAFKTSQNKPNVPPNQLGQNLLDFATSPQGRGLARGLLEASGYSTTPVSFGQAVAQGMAYMNEADQTEAARKQQEFENKLLERQLEIQEKEALAAGETFTQGFLEVPDGKGGMIKQPVNISSTGKMTSIGGSGGTNINIGGDKTSKGFEEVNKQYAGEFQKWNVSGGYANQLENLKKIDDVIATLEKAKDGGANVTGAIGAVPKFIRSFTNPTSVAVEDDIKSIIFQSLRETLGAQFTEREGERLVQASFNILLDEATNIKRLERMKDTILEAAKAKENAAIYFRENDGDMSGYTAQTAFSESASNDLKLETTFNGVFDVTDYVNLSDAKIIELYSTADSYEQQFIKDNAEEIGIKLK